VVGAARRRKMLAEWAMVRGLDFDPAKDRYMDDRFPDFECVNRGDSRYANNMARGRLHDLEVMTFDYHYSTGSGKNRSSHAFSAAIVTSPIALKPLLIRPEGFFDKVKEFLGFDDIDFESAEFSRKFFVSAPDRRWAYDVIHQRMMEHLLIGPRFSFQFGVTHIIVWRDEVFEPALFELAVEMVRGILDRLPNYLVQEQKELDTR
jgi:hypothetical protein